MKCKYNELQALNYLLEAINIDSVCDEHYKIVISHHSQPFKVDVLHFDDDGHLQIYEQTFRSYRLKKADSVDAEQFIPLKNAMTEFKKSNLYSKETADKVGSASIGAFIEISAKVISELISKAFL